MIYNLSMSHEFTRRDLLKVGGIGIAAALAISLRLTKGGPKTGETELQMEWIPAIGPVFPKAFADAEDPGQPWILSPEWDHTSSIIPFTLQTSAEITKDAAGEIILKIEEPRPDSLLLQTDMGYPLRPTLRNLAGKEIPAGFDGRILLSALNLGENSKKVDILLTEVAFLLDKNLSTVPTYVKNSNVPAAANVVILPGQIPETLPEPPTIRRPSPPATSLKSTEPPGPPIFFVRVTGSTGVNYYSGIGYEVNRFNIS